MISALVRASLYPDAFLLFGQMRAQGFGTSGFVIASLLTACTGSGVMVHQGFQIHSLILKNGFLYNVYAGTSLVNFYAAYGFHSCACSLFDKMLEKNVVSWTSLMVGYSDNGDFMEVINLYRLMRLEDVKGNQNTFTTVITSCGSLEDESLGCQVLGHVIKCGYEYDLSVANSLISMFGNLGRVREAYYVFNHMSARDTISWNSMISAYARNYSYKDSFHCFNIMCHVHEKVDAITLSALLSVCGSMDHFLWGAAVHGLVHKLGFDLNLSVCNTLLGMYSETRRSKEMIKLFEEMLEKDLISWNSLIVGHGQEGECMDALKGSFQEAQEAFHEMVNTGLKPDHVTFVSLLSSCSHGGLVDRGLKYYSLMNTKFGVDVGIEHCVCIIDLLGRSGRLLEAENFIRKMPIPPNDFVWRIHDLRVEMESSNVKKQPACSWIKIKRKISSFAIGDKSHYESDKIYVKLSELKMMIKEAGYVPDTSVALQDIDEEQKEDHLWKHCERLALAYG
ncbi:hypothetical protein L1987_13454 [Smallanthus sonchifolius]|uniref:Uncharacterized protein n=1 Tax=Smallanthus sonchifolius TaxID=185202 RepID=A0ACB9JI49_9ASTR|nr:hypothetical protein L1987_13454 [Smallanthus sonchifolius]